jgi:DNA-directed RNA polymerase specialized sigma24 family protein
MYCPRCHAVDESCFVTAGRHEASGSLSPAKQGSEPFARFYDATSGAAYSLALRITGGQPAAEAACEAAYLDLWGEYPATAFEAPPGTITDRLMEFVRARALSPGAVPAAAGRSPGSPAAYTLATTVRSALATINPSGRKALELACFGGMSVASIAELTGEPSAVIRASLREALLTIGAMTKQKETPQ